MSLIAKKRGDDFQQVPAGTHPAICNAVIDLGLQDGPYGTKPQVLLRFEFPTELIESGEYKGEPMVMSAFYTNSLSDKANLRRDLEGWRGKTFTETELEGFDLKNVLGKPCTIGVYHNENGKARIQSISAAMKGMDHELHNDLMWFSLDHHDENSKEFAALPEWVQDIVKKRVEEDTP